MRDFVIRDLSPQEGYIIIDMYLNLSSVLQNRYDAALVQNLVQDGFLERRGKMLSLTEKAVSWYLFDYDLNVRVLSLSKESKIKSVDSIISQFL